MSGGGRGGSTGSHPTAAVSGAPKPWVAAPARCLQVLHHTSAVYLQIGGAAVVPRLLQKPPAPLDPLLQELLQRPNHVDALLERCAQGARDRGERLRERSRLLLACTAALTAAALTRLFASVWHLHWLILIADHV